MAKKTTTPAPKALSKPPAPPAPPPPRLQTAFGVPVKTKAVKPPAIPKEPVIDPMPVELKFPKIKKAGFYDGLPDYFYHSDCCDSPSMSSSMAKTLIEECPQKMWSNSYMDPNREIKENRNFDMGHALHLIFLEPEKFEAGVVEIEFMDYRKDEAKRQKQVAYDAQKIPLLTHDLRTVWKMREALYDNPVARMAFEKNGVSERSYFVKDEETGVWLKARVDREMFKPRILIDYKTTISANPLDFPRSIFNYGYYIQQPWYQYVYKEATGEEIEECYFIAQEKEYPYLSSVIEVKPAAIEYGEKIMRKAIRKFADCLDKGQWHGYRDGSRPDQDGVITLDLPSHAYYELAEREERGDF